MTVFLVIAGVLIALHLWMRGKVVALYDETVKASAAVIAKTLIAEQENPAPGEWEAIGSIVINRAKKFGVGVADVIAHTSAVPYPWNDSAEFKHRFNSAESNKKYKTAYATALELVTTGNDPTAGSMGFVHTIPYAVAAGTVPKWLNPIRLVIPTGNGKVAVFGGDG